MPDKLATALISAPIGALCGFMGGLVSEYLKRRIGHLDAAEKLADEFSGDLTETARTLNQGRRPDIADVKSLSKQRRKLGAELSRLYIKGSNWAPIASALAAVDQCLEIADDAALSEEGVLVPQVNFEPACREIDRAVRLAANTDLIWKVWRGR
jgi:hypothetical protein